MHFLTRVTYLSIYICAILHVQIMPEHINISFEQAIKQSFYTRGVKDTWIRRKTNQTFVRIHYIGKIYS